VCSSDLYRGTAFRDFEKDAAEPNAIDPTFVLDKQGNQYLSYGSFFGGIFIVPLDKKTGFVKQDAFPRLKAVPITYLAIRIASIP
jgi:beta-xylosidase